MVIHDLKHPTDSAISQISNLQRKLDEIQNKIKIQIKNLKVVANQIKNLGQVSESSNKGGEFSLAKNKRFYQSKSLPVDVNEEPDLGQNLLDKINAAIALEHRSQQIAFIPEVDNSADEIEDGGKSGEKYFIQKLFK